jgi:hypothetical protein
MSYGTNAEDHNPASCFLKIAMNSLIVSVTTKKNNSPAPFSVKNSNSNRSINFLRMLILVLIKMDSHVFLLFFNKKKTENI